VHPVQPRLERRLVRRGVDAVREQVRALPTTPPKWRKKRYLVGAIACGAYARMDDRFR